MKRNRILQTGLLLLAGLRLLAAGETTSLALGLTGDLMGWSFSNGPEYPGATGNMSYETGELVVNGDFSHGGGYIGVFRSNRLDFGELRFRIRTDAKNAGIRFTDKTGQVHQHFIPLSGSAADMQSIVIPVAGSPGHHWGNPSDGILRKPVVNFGIIIHADSFPEKSARFRLSGISFGKLPADRPAQVEYLSEMPERNFIVPGNTDPIRLKLLIAPETIPAHKLTWRYLDYSGKETASGQAEFEPYTRELRIPPPAQTGYHDLELPALGIRSGVVVNEPFFGAPDEYFAIDSSFSWGGPPGNEAKIRSYLEILRTNGIVWSRDRIDWVPVNPAPGRYEFGKRFGRYRKIAADMGIKTLDTFHTTPRWNRNDSGSPSKSNKYPQDLIAAAKSWSDIVRQWSGTIKALEVWNEPDLSFGNSYPPEYVTAFTKAVSRRMAGDNRECKVVGGVFAWPREESNFYRLYLQNGLLRDVDALSYHTYNQVKALLPTVERMRRVEQETDPERAGIPYWITECGMPWRGGKHRASLDDDRHTAVEIVGKAAEFRALGFERYVAFGYKYYDENHHNFGMMDRNFAPMRSMAAYLHAVRVLSGKEYAGDIKFKYSVRNRVFTDGENAVIFLYNGLRQDKADSLELPPGLEYTRVTGLDGRLFRLQGRSVPMTDGAAYIHLSNAEAGKFLNTDTRAMKLYRLACAFRPVSRIAAPVVFQPADTLDERLYSCYGYEFDRNVPAEFRLWLNNLSDKSVTVAPRLRLPEEIEQVDFSGIPVTLEPGTRRAFRFSVKLGAGAAAGNYHHLLFEDENGNATPLAMALRTSERLTAVARRMPRPAGKFDLASLNAEKDWIELDKADWHGWQGGDIDCNIGVRFRVFYDERKFQLQVLVRDARHSNPHPIREAWNGDSVQFALQKRDQAGRQLTGHAGREFTAARCKDGELLFRSTGPNPGIVKNSAMRLWNLDRENRLYVIDLPGEELGTDGIVPGETWGFSLAVNGSGGTIRDGFLTWGKGIAEAKDSSQFNLLKLQP